jgi:uncharacterized membrane protein YraQ (UPF0718 family)
LSVRTRHPHTVGHGLLPLLVVVAAITVFRQPVAILFEGPAARTWVTLTLAIVLQAMPFLVLGVVVGAAISVLLPAGRLAALVRAPAGIAVPLAATAGLALPGCECSSVMVSRRLMEAGVPPPAAIAFQLAAPAVNPIVLAATAVAFPGRPAVVAARATASLATALIVGLVWHRWVATRADRWPTLRPPAVGHSAGGRAYRLATVLVRDLMQAGGFLVLGAGIGSAFQVTIAGAPFLAPGGGVAAVFTMAALAVVLCVCSEADAFLAASLAWAPMSARLAFMVVGPVVDLKLVSLQVASFGRAFAFRLIPLTFCVAVGCSFAAGLVLR